MVDPQPRPSSEKNRSRTDLDETLDQRPESTVFGDYELLEEIARGGMGVVYKARQHSLDRIVAIKQIISGEDAAEQELSRFRIEAQSAARLDHSGIVPVYGYGQIDGRPYLAMGFVNGPSLARRLAESGPLPPREAAALMKQVAEAVDFAHRKNIIHRDLKPGNVLIDEEGRARITDFGLAKRQDVLHSLTATGMVLGTPAYMSPEQAAGEEAGAASDIYSLGATLYTALTGRPPFESDSLPELIVQVAEQAPKPPSQVNAAVPKALDKICLKCLEKQLTNRYQSAMAVAEDLDRFLGSKKASRGDFGKLGIAITVTAVLLLTITCSIWYLIGRNGKALTSSNGVTAGSQKTLIESQLSPAEAKFVKSLEVAIDEFLPSPDAFIWSIRHANGRNAIEQAFQEFGFTLDSDVAEFADRLKRSSKDFQESVLCGLDFWEICAIESKQLEGLDVLRQHQEALDDIGWRRSLRLARTDANHKAILQIVTDALAASPTDKQFDLLSFQIATRALWEYPEIIKVLRILLKSAPQESLLSNMALAVTLREVGELHPSLTDEFAMDAISRLRTAVKLRPELIVPHMQIAECSFMIEDPATVAKELETIQEMKQPQAWPLIMAARNARSTRQFDKAVDLARQALAVDPTSSTGNVELVAALSLGRQDTESDKILKNIAATTLNKDIAFQIFYDISRILIASDSDIDLSRNDRKASELAWTYFFKYCLTDHEGSPPKPAIAPFDAEHARVYQEEWAEYLKVPVEWENSIGVKFRLIPPGEFNMGSTREEIAEVRFLHPENKYWIDASNSEAPRHRVRLSHPFYLSKFELRQVDYLKLMPTNPSWFSSTGSGKLNVNGFSTDEFPVETVSWFDSAEFCRQLSNRENLSCIYSTNEESPIVADAKILEHNGYRLATEAEWEFACRAGTISKYHSGSTEEDAKAVAWYAGNSGKRSHAVGELAANAFGLYDMPGNVGEWCHDGFGTRSYYAYLGKTAVDPFFHPNEKKSALRKIRGGTWGQPSTWCRCALRSHMAKTGKSPSYGIRLLTTVDCVRQSLSKSIPPTFTK